MPPQREAEKIAEPDVSRQEGEIVLNGILDDLTVRSSAESNIANVASGETGIQQGHNERARKILVDENIGHLADRANLLI